MRKALSDYSRAFETRDLALFKSVMPGLTADQEKAVGAAFKAGQQVALTVESIQVADAGRRPCGSLARTPWPGRR